MCVNVCVCAYTCSSLGTFVYWTMKRLREIFPFFLLAFVLSLVLVNGCQTGAGSTSDNWEIGS